MLLMPWNLFRELVVMWASQAAGTTQALQHTPVAGHQTTCMLVQAAAHFSAP
jgi:hypothetical protein